MRKVMLGLALCLWSCTVEAPTRSAGTAGGNTGTPPLQVRTRANLGNQVELVGAVIEPGKITPGVPTKVNMFFKVLDTIPADWMVFVHLEDAEGRAERLNADHAPAGGARPTSQWKKGETVRDEFTIYLPPGSPARGVNVLVGLWDPRSDQRLKLQNPNEVRSDGNDRILLAQIPVAQP